MSKGGRTFPGTPGHPAPSLAQTAAKNEESRRRYKEEIESGEELKQGIKQRLSHPKDNGISLEDTPDTAPSEFVLGLDENNMPLPSKAQRSRGAGA